MDSYNWVREYNKLLETLNARDSYFSGGKFISVIREFDPYFPDYDQYIGHRREKNLTTSRKNYFYDILMSFKEDIRKKIMDRFYEVAKEMGETASKKEKIDDVFSAFYFDNLFSKEEFNEPPRKAEAIKEAEIAATETIENPKVFISYSWDDEDHKQWILNLSKRLFDNGVQVILDRYELKPGKNMMHFMESAIPSADKVLVVFTPNYKAKAEDRKGGVGYEYSILNAELYQQIATNEKFIPILKTGAFTESIPAFMQQFIAINMTDPNTFEDRLNELLLSIYDKPQIDKPALGKKPF